MPQAVSPADRRRPPGGYETYIPGLDAPLLGPLGRGCDLRGRPRRRGATHFHPRTPDRVDGTHGENRLHAVRRREPGSRRHNVHLRLERVRRERRPARARGRRSGSAPSASDRPVRGRMSLPLLGRRPCERPERGRRADRRRRSDLSSRRRTSGSPTSGVDRPDRGRGLAAADRSDLRSSGPQVPVRLGHGIGKLVGPAIAADELGSIDAAPLSHDHHDDNLDDAGTRSTRENPVRWPRS